MCGPVTYNINVMPSHGIIMMINDTVYSITGLNYNTNYTITVYATNNHSSGEPTTISVAIKPFPPSTYVLYSFNHTYVNAYMHNYVVTK